MYKGIKHLFLASLYLIAGSAFSESVRTNHGEVDWLDGDAREIAGVVLNVMDQLDAVENISFSVRSVVKQVIPQSGEEQGASPNEVVRYYLQGMKIVGGDMEIGRFLITITRTKTFGVNGSASSYEVAFEEGCTRAIMSAMPRIMSSDAVEMANILLDVREELLEMTTVDLEVVVSNVRKIALSSVSWLYKIDSVRRTAEGVDHGSFNIDITRTMEDLGWIALPRYEVVLSQRPGCIYPPAPR